MALNLSGSDRVFRFRDTNIMDRWANKLRYASGYSRLPLVPELSATQQNQLQHLREFGYVVLERHIDPLLLKTLQTELQVALDDLKFEMPCLAQARIKPDRDQDLIDNYLFAATAELASRGLTFARSEALSYEQVIRDFNPSTLTLYMLKESAAYRSLWLDPAILGIAAGYLGFVPKMVEAYVRRNFPSPYRTMNHFWHRDLNHKHYMLKAFVFLSDCTRDTGPHEFVRGSHRRFTPLNGKRYYDDEEIDRALAATPQARIVSEVPAGTVILEDTRGLHRADMPKTGFRDLGYATFMPWNDGPVYYELPLSAYEKLSAVQQAFVPRRNVI
jgi:hypothetical protein